MTPIKFPEANKTFVSSSEFDKSQVQDIPAWLGEAQGGSCDGVSVTVVAWKPDIHDLLNIADGKPVFLTMFGGLAPHMLTTDFHSATHPA